MVRVAGTNVACVSLYLQSGHFIDGEVNANILAELRSFLSSLRCPWFVAGDWNSHLPDVLGTRLNEVLKGQFVGIGQGTAGGVNELDFALIHPSMHRCVRVQSDWMVPFKLHCALHFTWQAESVKDLVPGLRVFSDDFDPVTQEERQGQIQPVRPNKALILEFQAEDPITVQCAAFSATAEAAGTLGSSRGRGSHCQVQRTALMGNPVQVCRWYGREHAFWTQVGVLAMRTAYTTASGCGSVP